MRQPVPSSYSFPAWVHGPLTSISLWPFAGPTSGRWVIWLWPEPHSTSSASVAYPTLNSSRAWPEPGPPGARSPPVFSGTRTSPMTGQHNNLEDRMKLHRLGTVLTAINLVLLVLTVSQARSAAAQTGTEVLRGHALELVDARGVVRARLGTKGPDGPIELDLFDKRGIIRVKLGADEDGSGLVLSEGGTSASRGYIQIIAKQTGTPDRPTTTSITLRGGDGRERVITPP